MSINNNLKENFPSLVDKYWDYEKNAMLPEDVGLSSKDEFWWRDNNFSFKLSIVDLHKKDAGTSFNEQALYFYLKQLFHNVQNRFKYKIEKSYEIDIYIPEINLGIEYDGVYWHKNKVAKDIEKSIALNDAGIFLIRLREEKLEPIELDKTISINVDLKSNFSKYINIVVKIIYEHADELGIVDRDILERLPSFCVSPDNFEETKISILDQYRQSFIENNITHTCLIKYWDYDKNNILPQKVSINDHIKAWFKCKYGFNKRVDVGSIMPTHTIQCNNNDDCVNCESFYCPLANYCDTEHTYWEHTMCASMKKYFYYRLFVEAQNNPRDFTIATMNDYIGKNLQNNDDDYVSFHNVYNRFKNNPDKLSKMRALYNPDILSMKGFDSFDALNEFLEKCHPLIFAIDFESFDTPELRVKFVKLLEQLLMPLGSKLIITDIAINWGNLSPEFKIALQQFVIMWFKTMCGITIEKDLSFIGDKNKLVELHRFYLINKDVLNKNASKANKLKKLIMTYGQTAYGNYNKIDMTNFSSFDEFKEFYLLFDPPVCDVDYKEFDNDEYLDKFGLFLKEYINNHISDLRLTMLLRSVNNDLSDKMLSIIRAAFEYALSYGQDPSLRHKMNAGVAANIREMIGKIDLSK